MSFSGPRTVIDIDEPFLEEAWNMCGMAGKPNAAFRDAIADALFHYKRQLTKEPRLSTRERTRLLGKIEKHSEQLRQLLLSLNDETACEFSDVYTARFEPEELQLGSIDTEFEGLSYFEAQVERLDNMLSELSEGVRIVSSAGYDIKGRPKQNFGLEDTIKSLGEIFQAGTGRTPMEGYGYSDTLGDHPYTGPFLDFLTCVLWGYAKREVPSNSAIGEAARRAFGLRK